MNENPTFMCIDAGGENCPCELAESGNCIVCGRLSGGDCSGCKWHGVCIYNEYIQNGRKIKRNREDFEAEIVSRKLISEDIVLFGIKTGKGFAVKCSPPGSYVFLREKNSEQYFNVPISVMKTDVENGIIFLLVKCISTKTKKLLNVEKKLIIRGPYKNGIFGIGSINEIIKKGKNEHRKGKILIAAKGIGIAPGIKLIQFLNKNCEFSLYFDLINIPKEYFEKEISDFTLFDEIKYVNFNDSGDILKMKFELASEGYDGFAIFTSEYYINMFNEMAEDIKFEGKIIISNNFNLCCGEGICGACSVSSKNGETVKMCKCRMTGEEMLKRKVIFV